MSLPARATLTDPARRTHCPRGHEYTEANTYRFGPDRRRRDCRACRAAKNPKKVRRSVKGAANPNWRGGDVPLKCERCGGDFSVKPLRKDSARFCSLPCANEWQRAERPGLGQRFPDDPRYHIGRPKKERVPINCAVCGKQTLILPCRVDRKFACSPGCVRRMRLANPNIYSRCQRGKRGDLDGQFFRSAWEANYARFLNLLIQKGQVASWAFEPDTFWFLKIKRGVRSYTPDFKVTEPSGKVYYVEVKGWMDPKSKTKIKRMAKYHPGVELRVVDAKAYKELARKIGGAIPNWEK